MNNTYNEDVQEAYLELEKIKNSKNRITHLIADNPHAFSDDQVKELVYEIISM